MGQGRGSFSSSFDGVIPISRPTRPRWREAEGGPQPAGASMAKNPVRQSQPGGGRLEADIANRIERERQTGVRQRRRVAAFVALLFDEHSDDCERVVVDAAAESGDPQHVAEVLFEPAARLIGENWSGDELDFFKVTVAVSRMQRLFRRITSDFPPAVRSDISRCVLLAPAPGEQHLFGLSVVDDAFRRAGWEVDCCGHGEELEMVRLAAVNHYQVIGLSVSADRHLPDLVSIVQRLRSRSLNRSVIVMAGGSMVMRSPQSATDAGFDMLAVDAPSAVRLAESVVSRHAHNADQRMAAE
jgi:methanogenic corrinoid protein MtbC1